MRLISEQAFIDELTKLDDLRTLSTKTIGEVLKRVPTALDLDEVVEKLEDLKMRAIIGECPDTHDECDPRNCDSCFMNAVLRIVKGKKNNQ